MSDDAAILLVANMLPPLIGGTAMVYDRVAASAGGRIHVLTASTDPGTGQRIAGWAESDRERRYPISRTRWLRPPQIENIRRRMALLDIILIDLPIMAFVFCVVVYRARRIGARTICIGELQGLGWLALLLHWLTPWRIALYTHGEEVVQRSYNRLARLRYPALRRMDMVIAVSRFTGDFLVDQVGVAPDRVRIVPPGVDSVRFSPAATPPHDPYIFAAGRLIERKGFDRLIDAFAVLHKRFCDYRLKIAGTGPQLAALKAQVAALGLTGSVDFLGPIDDAALAQCYRGCRLFALPNRTLADGDTEGFGLVFLEANGCGKPVVGGRAGGTTDAVRDGETGLLIDGHDVDAIAAAIEWLLTDDDFYDRCAHEAIVQARAFTWDRTARMVIEALTSDQVVSRDSFGHSPE
jgi:phosphatidylinositol alpha-1,6-mannosyltransferase